MRLNIYEKNVTVSCAKSQLMEMIYLESVASAIHALQNVCTPCVFCG